MLVTSITFDIFIIDRTVIGKGKFCIEEHIRRYGYNCPVLVFNEKDIAKLADYWHSNNTSIDGKKYIDEFAFAIQSNPIDLLLRYESATQKKNVLRGKARDILTIFLQNINISLSKEEIDLKLNEVNLKIKKDVLYTYVSKLRTLCSTCSNCLRIKMQNSNYILQVEGFFKNEKPQSSSII